MFKRFLEVELKNVCIDLSSKAFPENCKKDHKDWSNYPWIMSSSSFNRPLQLGKYGSTKKTLAGVEKAWESFARRISWHDIICSSYLTLLEINRERGCKECVDCLAVCMKRRKVVSEKVLRNNFGWNVRFASRHERIQQFSVVSTQPSLRNSFLLKARIFLCHR